MIATCDTQNNNPAKAKSCAASLIGKGADIMFVTCDVEFSAPATQEAINRGVLAIAPCIGTDQMGPKRFGAKGRLAFSFGNVAQDEGAAMAEYAWSEGLEVGGDGDEHAARLLQGRRQGVRGPVQALGGKVVAEESYATGANNVQNAVTPAEQREGRRDRDVDRRVRRAARARRGLRTLGNNTPILNSWAGDGTYWLPKDPR